jgi:hypothetical protein
MTEEDVVREEEELAEEDVLGEEDVLLNPPEEAESEPDASVLSAIKAEANASAISSGCWSNHS